MNNNTGYISIIRLIQIRILLYFSVWNRNLDDTSERNKKIHTSETELATHATHAVNSKTKKLVISTKRSRGRPLISEICTILKYSERIKRANLLGTSQYREKFIEKEAERSFQQNELIRLQSILDWCKIRNNGGTWYKKLWNIRVRIII